MISPSARLAADLFTIGVLMSVAAALAPLTWRLAGDAGSEPAAAATIAVPPPPIDLAPVIALAPFGSVAPAAGTDAQPLELRGILLAEPRAASTVLLATAGGPVQAYAVGQSAGGAIIDAIAIDHVLIRTAGGVQRLDYPNRVNGAVATSATPAAATAGTGPSAGTAAPADGVAAIRALIPPEALGAPSRAAPPPAGLPLPPARRGILDSMGATPTAGGGYRIGDNLTPVMQVAGLRPGDIIERINGSSVAAAGGDGQLLASAMASGSAQVDIVRDGKRMSLSFPVR